MCKLRPEPLLSTFLNSMCNWHRAHGLSITLDTPSQPPSVIPCPFYSFGSAGNATTAAQESPKAINLDLRLRRIFAFSTRILAGVFVLFRINQHQRRRQRRDTTSYNQLPVPRHCCCACGTRKRSQRSFGLYTSWSTDIEARFEVCSVFLLLLFLSGTGLTITHMCCVYIRSWFVILRLVPKCSGQSNNIRIKKPNLNPIHNEKNLLFRNI